MPYAQGMLFWNRAKPTPSLPPAPKLPDRPGKPRFGTALWAGPTPSKLLDALASQDDLCALTEWQFDEVVAALFRRLGATKVKVQASTDGDAGIDISMLFEGQPTGLQCLHLSAKHQTTLDTVKWFAANLASTGSRAGYFLTTGRLPYEAKAILADSATPIYLLDGDSIWTLIVNSRANAQPS